MLKFVFIQLGSLVGLVDYPDDEEEEEEEETSPRKKTSLLAHKIFTGAPQHVVETKITESIQ